MTATSFEARLESAERDLLRLRAEPLIRACVVRYMTLCDQLDAGTPLNELVALFTRDARWEGRGARYEGAFGGHRGHEEIAAMFRTYMTDPPHFAFNAHFLCSESIVVAEDATTADASWLMLQTSTFATGTSHLNAARLSLQMALEDGQWRIAHFQTENLLSRPVGCWNDAKPLPVPQR
jgi:hypothetical protein